MKMSVYSVTLYILIMYKRFMYKKVSASCVSSTPDVNFMLKSRTF